MALFAIIAVALFGLAAFAPQLWIGHQMKKHSVHRPDLQGTGGELAVHLIEHFGLTGVRVEKFAGGDHYDPDAKVVRLSESTHDGQHLAAVAVAAHEVGHAMQDANNERGLALRQKLAKLAMSTDKIATIFFIAAPVLALLARTPAAFLGFAAIGIGLMLIRVLVHLVTLPVEYDASFGKALPILKEGGYLSEDDLPAARSLLKAAALTYVAAAAVGLFDLARLLRILR